MVRCLTPNSTQAVMMRRKFSTPARWPSKRGRPRAKAQRPLPSMIIATCEGILSGRGGEITTSAAIGDDPSDFLDLGVFARAQLLDLFYVLIGELLQVGFAAFQIVFGDHLLFFKFAQIIVGGAADIPHGDPRFFQPVVNDFNQVLAALFGQRWDIQANDFAVVVRRQ